MEWNERKRRNPGPWFDHVPVSFVSVDVVVVVVVFSSCFPQQAKRCVLLDSRSIAVAFTVLPLSAINRIQKRISHGNSFLFSSFSGSCFFLLLLAWKKFLNKRFRRGPLLHLQNSRDSGKGLLNLLLPNCLPLILFVY